MLQNHDFTLDEVIACLTELEQLCTDRTEYDNLCFLLTLPSITSDNSYKDWNPSSARINCFNEVSCVSVCRVGSSSSILRVVGKTRSYSKQEKSFGIYDLFSKVVAQLFINVVYPSRYIYFYVVTAVSSGKEVYRAGEETAP